MEAEHPSRLLALPSILQPSQWRMRGLYWSHDGIASENEGELQIYDRPHDWYLVMRTWNPESALTWEVWAKPWLPGVTRRNTRAISTLFGPNQGLIWVRPDRICWRYRIPRLGLVGTDDYTPGVSPDRWQMRGQLQSGRQTVATYEWQFVRIG